jgi:hypothetical protein
VTGTLALIGAVWLAVGMAWLSARVRRLEAQRGPVVVEICRTHDGFHVHLAGELSPEQSFDVMAGLRSALLAQRNGDL